MAATPVSPGSQVTPGSTRSLGGGSSPRATGSARASGLRVATPQGGNGPVALAEPSLPGVRRPTLTRPREPTRKGRTFPELENTGAKPDQATLATFNHYSPPQPSRGCATSGPSCKINGRGSRSSPGRRHLPKQSVLPNLQRTHHERRLRHVSTLARISSEITFRGTVPTLIHSHRSISPIHERPDVNIKRQLLTVTEVGISLADRVRSTVEELGSPHAELTTLTSRRHPRLRTGRTTDKPEPDNHT
jgi:hypothetical protein